MTNKNTNSETISKSSFQHCISYEDLSKEVLHILWRVLHYSHHTNVCSLTKSLLETQHRQIKLNQHCHTRI